MKKGSLKNFSKFTVSVLIKLLAWGLNLIKKVTQALMFPYEFCEIFEKHIFKEHLLVTASAITNYFRIPAEKKHKI